MVTIGQMLINVFWISVLTSLYFLLFAFIPFWLRGCKVTGGKVFDNLVTSFLVSNFTVINVVYLLAFLKIYNAFSLIIGLLTVAVAYLYFFRWEAAAARANKIVQGIIFLSDGSYTLRVLYNNFRIALNGKVKFLVTQVFRHPINITVFMLGAGYALYYRFFGVVTQMHFNTSDLYVHTNWIKYLDNNIVYMNGIYPFGYHNMLSAFRHLTGINMVYFMHLMGGVIGVTIVIGMYYMCRRVFKSQTAANCAFVFYCACEAIFHAAIIRQTMALPQEYAMIFMYPAAFFLHRYLVKKNVKDAIYFSLSFCLTIATHFYITITLVFLCFGIVVSHAGYLFKGKTLIRLIIVFVIITAITLVPFAIGQMMNISWEKSMAWALSVVGGAPGDGATLPEGADNTGYAPVDENRSIEDILLKDYIRQITREEWFFAFMYIGIAGIVVSLLLMIFKEYRARAAFILGCIIYALVIVAVMIAPAFKLPALMPLNRATIFYAYISPIVLALPIELVHILLYRKNLFLRSVYIVAAASVGIWFGYYLVFENHLMTLGTSLRFQYDGAVTTYYKIVNDHPDFNWTIVSPVEETCMVRGNGYHYELRDFLLGMDRVDEHTKMYLPTKYVFIYIEKQPLRFNEVLDLNNPIPKPSGHITLDEAKVDFYSLGESVRTNVLYLYNEYEPRRILESKAYYWAQEYSKYFPDEMKLYYEDEQLLIYKVTQNMYALNNFAIPYAGNSDTVSGYD